MQKENFQIFFSIPCSAFKLRKGYLLVDMDCVGLRPGFSMIEKVISLYWEMGEKEGAVLFVEEVLRRGIPYLEEDEEGHKGGPTGYLAWKMMVSKQFDV